jgi:hypothetical protein
MFCVIGLVTNHAAGKTPIPPDSISVDTITFTGRQLMVMFVSATLQSVKFENEFTGIVVIDWNDIQSLRVSSKSLEHLQELIPGYPVEKVIPAIEDAGQASPTGIR